MPIPALVGASIASAGGNVIGDVMNMLSTNAQNRKSRQFTEKIRAQDRQWALDDWARNNTYNSPAAQMLRMQEAGLNPRLMYGNSATGGGNADQVRGTSTQTPTFRAAEFQSPGQIGSTIAQYLNWESQMLSNDNLKKQGDVLAAEAANKAANTSYVDAQTRRSIFDYDLESELRDTSADYRRGLVYKQNAETQGILSNTEMRIAETSQNIRESAEKILNLRLDRARTNDERKRIQADIKRINADTLLKKLDADLKKMGIQPHDPLYMRFLSRIVGSEQTRSTISKQFNKAFDYPGGKTFKDYLFFNPFKK